MNLKRLLGYMKVYKLQSIMAPLFKCLEACFELFVPLVVAEMIDQGIRLTDIPYVVKMGGLLILLAIVGMACSLTAQYFAAKVAIHTGSCMRNDLFRHINELGYDEIDAIGTSTLMTRMTSDINQVQTGVNMFLRLFMRSPFIVFGSMLMAFNVDVKAALVFVIAIPLLVLVVFGIILVTMPMYRNVQKQLDKVMQVVRENLSGVRVVRAFNRQASEKQSFREENDFLVRIQVQVGKLSALMNPLTYVIINLFTVMLIIIGGKRVMIGALTQGQVVALVNYMSQILVELIKLANLVILISKALACLNRVENIFSYQSKVVNPAVVLEGDNDCEEVVVFEDVAFAYAKKPVLEGLGFKVKRGETVGIIGGTGSGKTSLVNLIPRFYDVCNGKVLVNGVDVRSQDIDKLRHQIGIVPQKSVLFKGTLRDNMLWGNENASDGDIFEALRIAQAIDFVNEKKVGLDLLIEQGGRNLSGGQRQRLAIARALVRKPEILILDDAASALDYATDAALRKAIHQNSELMSVFIISQRVATVMGADQIIVLDDGRLCGVGSHEQLLAGCEVYREICMSQLSKEEVIQNG